MEKEKDLKNQQINEEQIDKISGGMIHHNTSKQAKAKHEEFEVINEYGGVVRREATRHDANRWAIYNGYGTDNITTSTLKKLRDDGKK